jgi:predicted amidohydrolase YtcJ
MPHPTLPVCPEGPADLVFRNGSVYTVAGPAPWAQAVAVRGTTISYVGDDAGADAFVGPGTRVVDLAGRLLLPGFVEGHTHPFLGAFLTSGVDLQVPTLADAQTAIAEYARQHPDGPVRGFGWRVDMFGPDGPTRADLDVVLPDRPGFFFAIDGHSLWANSKALELAGVDRDTPDPIPGFSYYARDASGDPTGYILEVNAVLAVVNAVEPISPGTMGTLLHDWLPKASAARHHLGVRRRRPAHRRRPGLDPPAVHRRRPQRRVAVSRRGVLLGARHAGRGHGGAVPAGPQ